MNASNPPHVVSFTMRIYEDVDTAAREYAAQVGKNAVPILVSDVTVVEHGLTVVELQQDHVSLANVDEVRDEHYDLPAYTLNISKAYWR